MLTECETVLDDSQKQMLATRRNTKKPARQVPASAAAGRDSVAAGKDSAKSSK